MAFALRTVLRIATVRGLSRQIHISRPALAGHSLIEPAWPVEKDFSLREENVAETDLLRDLALKSTDEEGYMTEHGKQLLRELISERRALHGSRHPSTLTAIGRYITVLQQERNFADAEPLCYEVEATARGLLGDKHEVTRVASASLAAVLLSQGKMTDAEPVLRREYEASRAILGDEHPDVLLSLCTLVDCLASMHKWEECNALVHDEYNITRSVYGPAHPHSVRAAVRVASILDEQGKREEAHEIRTKAMLLSAPMFSQPDRSSTWSQRGDK